MAKDTVYSWQGRFVPFVQRGAKEIPVLLRYQAYDTIPGQYAKQLLVGTLINKTEKDSLLMMGFVQNQEDRSYHFYKMNRDGKVDYALILGQTRERMEGYEINPVADEFVGVFSLSGEDFSIAPKSIKVDPEEIFGNYTYDFGLGMPKGYFSLLKNEDGTAKFKIYSKDHDKGGEVEIERDSVALSGTSFVVDTQDRGNIIWAARVQFYKGFAVIGFIKPNSDEGKFGKGATIEGIFIKQN